MVRHGFTCGRVWPGSSDTPCVAHHNVYSITPAGVSICHIGWPCPGAAVACTAWPLHEVVA